MENISIIHDSQRSSGSKAPNIDVSSHIVVSGDPLNVSGDEAVGDQRPFA